MLERLDGVDTEKLDRRLASVGAALDRGGLRTVAEGACRAADAALETADCRDGRSRPHVCAGTAARRCGSRPRSCATGSSSRRTAVSKQAAPHVRTIKRAQDMLGNCTTCRCSRHMSPPCRRSREPGAPQSRAALEILRATIEDQCRHLHGRYIASAGVLRDAALAVRKSSCRRSRIAARRARSMKMALSPAGRRARRRRRPLNVATLELYLIRHGVAAERGEEYPDDSKRPLTSGGISRLRKEAKALEELGVGFDHIITSPLIRTRQTADIFAESLNPNRRCRKATRLRLPAHRRRSSRNSPNICARVGSHWSGHEPNIGELAARLIGARLPLEFKKGGICRIDFESSRRRV